VATAARGGLEAVARLAIERPGIESAAIFIRVRGTDGLELGAAEGVAGPALERLVEAVQNPAHPIARTLADGVASYNVTPMAPGGPALRSHVPVMSDRAVGVLAVAHDEPLGLDQQRFLVELAARAAQALD
jgi:GAF domain-containing protein